MPTPAPIIKNSLSRSSSTSRITSEVMCLCAYVHKTHTYVKCEITHGSVQSPGWSGGLTTVGSLGRAGSLRIRDAFVPQTTACNATNEDEGTCATRGYCSGSTYVPTDPNDPCTPEEEVCSCQACRCECTGAACSSTADHENKVWTVLGACSQMTSVAFSEGLCVHIFRSCELLANMEQVFISVFRTRLNADMDGLAWLVKVHWQKCHCVGFESHAYQRLVVKNHRHHLEHK
jgi:hypothetical protein